MAGVATSPTVRRWELAARLRQLRVDAGLTVDQAAAHLMCSTAKISRLETAVRGASTRDVRDLCVLYQVTDDEREHLMSLAREAKERAWWQEARHLDAHYSTYIGLEAAATGIRDFEALFVPGLLQTPRYSRALIEGLRPAGTFEPAVVDEMVAVRAKRQDQIWAADPPSLHFVIDEAALRRAVGSNAIMREQFSHLIEVSESQTAVVQVVPFAAGPHPGVDGSFIILEMATDGAPDVVYVESLLGEHYLDRPSDVERYSGYFDVIADRGLDRRASWDMLAALRRDGPGA
jgi:transcriptional regulator with XRE-family HTH domain